MYIINIFIIIIPFSQVIWLFNDESIVSPDYKMFSKGDRHCLQIGEVFDEDAGVFSATAKVVFYYACYIGN